MRPFRFFFGLSFAVIMFFFFARFVIMALIAAAIMSVIFHIGRKAKNFFRNLQWEEDHYFDNDFRRPRRMSPRFTPKGEALFYDFPKRNPEYLSDYRSIKVQ